mgnify:CR=1 FL=1
MVVQNTSFASQDELEMPFESSNSNDEDEAVDPFMYSPARYFAFSRGAYDLMVKDLLGEVKVTLEALRCRAFRRQIVA